ncbi:polysaccharide biosynthesis/export family protein [Pantanalinema rosaneae CENA516]|uniref:polysaccharide biosynthesis/export family protein n=1 Tax=Pantanalinema rosaneae TaxID=1620701 RepID=UPI003D6E55F7
MNRGITQPIAGILLGLLAGTITPLPVYAQTRTPLLAPPLDPSQVPTDPTQIPVAPTSPPVTTPLPGRIQPPTSQQDVGTYQPNNAYTLGAGDIVRVDIFDTPELVLDPRYTVLLDGSLNLPWIGSVSVQGLTLSQAADVISQRYGRFIRNPVITVNLLAPRPLKVGVIGEVNRPGSYIISVISNEVTQTSLNQRSSAEGGNQWPTVSKAIQTASGITELADIRNIRIRRLQPTGGEEVVTVDLWRFLREGDLSQDILLRDGDTILIPTATVFDPSEATKIALSNFSPDRITVNVVGEVDSPGAVELRPNTTLNQAVLTAGGFRSGRAVRGVDLIRLNPDGSVTKRRIKVDLAQSLNQDVNPPLHNNDIIVVRRNFFAKVGDFMNVGVVPFDQGVGLFNLIRGLFPSNND